MCLPDKSDTRFPFTGESCGAALRAIGLASFPSGTSTRAAPGGQRGRQRGTPKGGRAGTRPDLAICGQPAHSKRDVSHIQPATSLPLTPSFLLPSGAAFVLRHASDSRTRFFLAIYCGPLHQPGRLWSAAKPANCWPWCSCRFRATRFGSWRRGGIHPAILPRTVLTSAR